MTQTPKMTLALQWARYLDCNPCGKRLYQYSQFCKKVGDFARTHDLVARIAHEPGRTMLVDWAGLTASVFDPATGRRSPAYLFVASFPWSTWVYAECFPDMRTRSWISAHVHAFRAAGGVPDILVPDNCATATDRRRRSEPIKVNDAYLEMAEHYGCAVVPARVRKPRDKAAAEKAVDLCETWVLAPLADERLTLLEELNAEVHKLVDALNARPFSRREGSRDDAFLGEERAALNPLPPSPFEWCEWRRCKVAPDYHVQCEHMRYSVPHRLVGRTVDVRLGSSTVAVLDGGEVVAEHRRLRGRRGQYSTDPAHMPPEHLEAQSLWTRAWFERRAGEVGPETRRLVGAVLDAHPVEAQGYVPCSNILSLSRRGRAAELEAACVRINAAGGAATYTRVKNTMSALRAEALTARGGATAAHAGRVRGAGYYRRDRG
ncbi:IS21 family transposase [Thermophilibacter mediterraneus]|uniref:IS21 family transposase n=1 Tax=Thermophilibacter mediterraneus TaxID=1871031 RepID=UPI00320AD225